jgi:hypothetical protein
LKPAFENTNKLKGAYTFIDYEIDVLRRYNGNHIETLRSISYAKTPSIIQCREQVQHLEIPFHIHNSIQDFRILARVIMGIPRIHWPALKILTFSGCPESVASVGGRRDTACHLSITDIVVIPIPTFWYLHAYSLPTTGFILSRLRL